MKPGSVVLMALMVTATTPIMLQAARERPFEAPTARQLIFSSPEKSVQQPDTPKKDASKKPAHALYARSKTPGVGKQPQASSARRISGQENTPLRGKTRSEEANSLSSDIIGVLSKRISKEIKAASATEQLGNLPTLKLLKKNPNLLSQLVQKAAEKRLDPTDKYLLDDHINTKIANLAKDTQTLLEDLKESIAQKTDPSEEERHLQYLFFPEKFEARSILREEVEAESPHKLPVVHYD